VKEEWIDGLRSSSINWAQGNAAGAHCLVMFSAWVEVKDGRSAGCFFGEEEEP
jgi:hypothetical protein